MPLAKSAEKWIDIFKKNPRAELRLFCFPYAGSSNVIYRSWAPALSAFAEVVAVQYPGRGNRISVPPFTRLQPLADAIFEELHSFFTEKPFVFFGHSMGATIAFEVAARIAQASGAAPVVFVASGRQAPHLPERDAPTYQLPEPEFISELRRLNGTPREILDNEEVMQLLLPTIRADFEAIQTYQYAPTPPLQCPLVVLGGMSDVETPRSDLEAWSVHTTSTCTVKMFPGDHFFLHSCEAMVLQVLSRELMFCLQALRGSAPQR